MCARQPPERRRVDSRAGAGGGTAGLRLGRVYPHARGALVPDRKPVLRLALRVRTRTAHERPADLPRSWQGAGGSSSINGMIFQRGNPLDYERWAADPGMEAWDYAHCLPYFKRMETCMAGADTWLDQPASHTPCFSVGGRGDSPASSPTLDGDQQHPTGSAPSLSPSSFGAGATRCCSAPSSALQAFGVAQGRMNDAACPARSAGQ